jgi:kynurenine 3-monooxygenase
MVTFQADLPYSVAKQKGNAQDKLLLEICKKVGDVGSLDLNDILEQVKNL